MKGIAYTEDVSGETVPVMTYIEGLIALYAALSYIKQQAAALPIDTVLLRRCCDIAAKNKALF